MFGYASNETDVLMPAPITYAHRLVKKQADVRKSGRIDFLGPDAKSQLTLAYDGEGSPCGLEAIVLSTQHSEGIEQKVIEEAVVEEIIKPTLPSDWFNKRTKIFVNPTGTGTLSGINEGFYSVTVTDINGCEIESNSVYVKDEVNGIVTEVPTAPALIRVIEASNTGDLTTLPIIRAINKVKGKIEVCNPTSMYSPI